jgi:hypothetical protein
MRKHASKILAILLLIGVAESLAACVVEDDHYRGHYWHEDEWHHRY